MNDLFVRKLISHVDLFEADQDLTRSLVGKSVYIPRRHHSLASGIRGSNLHQIEQGFVCRYRQLADGRRQIVGLLIPGDFLDIRKFLRPAQHLAFDSLSQLVLRAYPADRFLNVVEASPRTAKAIWRILLSEEAIMEEWLVSLGQRTALERVAHLMCELFVRLAMVNSPSDGTFALPVTQQDLGEAMGLSTVHINRTLKALREMDLMAMQAGRVTIRDFSGLAGLGMFSPEYLLFRSAAAFSARPSRNNTAANALSP